MRRSSTSELPPKKVTASPGPSIVLPPNGKYFKSKSGEISLSTYPRPYRSNTDIVWIIEVLKGYRVYLQIFDIRIM